MKRNKLVLIAKILVIITICLIGFGGMYLPWKKGFEMNNSIKDFTLSKDLKGYREITIEAHERDYENKKEDLTEENFLKSKEIMEKRITDLGVQDYNLSLDKSSGTIYIQIPEDDLTDTVVSNITQTGSIEIKDSEDEKELLNKERFKESTVVYGTTKDNKQVVVLQLEFDKDGTETLKNISENEYKTLSEEETKTETDKNSDNKSEKDSENGKDDKNKQKKVAVYLSGSKAIDFSFEEPVTDGKIKELSIGNATTDPQVLQENEIIAKRVAIILNNGVLPLKYEVGKNNYVESDITSDTIRDIIIVSSVIVGILLIYMIIKNKLRGLLAAISFIGFIALYLIALRVCNVTIALSGIVGIILIVLLNYLVNMKLIKVDNKENKKYYKEYLDIIMKLLPILAISIVFVFMPIMHLASFGMVMFWGILIILLYNLAITKRMVD